MHSLAPRAEDVRRDEPVDARHACAGRRRAGAELPTSGGGATAAQPHPVFERMLEPERAENAAQREHGRFAAVREVTNSPGKPLDAETRAFFESRFAHDFSDVRVHTDAKAAQSAEAFGALAYTANRDVVFGAGQFSPATTQGRILLAHELAHAVQNRRGGGTGWDVSDASDAAESSADAAAHAVMAELPVPELGTAGRAIQRAAVKTSGGEFDTTLYQGLSKFVLPGSVPPTSVVGADILLEFTANELVESTKIGLIQTVKGEKHTSAGSAVSDTDVGTGDEAQLIMGAGQKDPGREIDNPVHPNGSAAPATSPIYGSAI